MPAAAAPAAPHPALDERLAFIVHQLGAQMTRICNPLFRQYHVDQISAQILVLAAERDGIGVGEIIALLKLPQSTISHQVKRLEQHRYIARRRDPADQRIVRIVLTATGHLVAAACNAVSLEVYRAMIGDMDQATSEAVRGSLTAMLARLEEVRSAQAMPPARPGSAGQDRPPAGERAIHAHDADRRRAR